MDPKIVREVERLVAEAPDILEEIKLAAEEDATFEEIERAKAVAAAFIAKYDELLKTLDLPEKREVLQRLGQNVGDIEGKLTQLREAPE
jgi:hypothetical protein